jgi:hypothetical protein
MFFLDDFLQLDKEKKKEGEILQKGALKKKNWVQLTSL